MGVEELLKKRDELRGALADTNANINQSLVNYVIDALYFVGFGTEQMYGLRVKDIVNKVEGKHNLNIEPGDIDGSLIILEIEKKVVVSTPFTPPEKYYMLSNIERENMKIALTE